MVVGHEGHTIAAGIGGVEGTVEDVRAQRLFRLDERLREVLRVGLTDPNVIAVLDEDFGEAERQTVDLVEVTLQEEHAAGLVGHGHAVGQFRRRAEPVEHRLFVVVARNALLLAEHHVPLVGALLVNTIEHFVQDGLDY